MPPPGNIGNRETSLDKALFELITDHYVKMIRILVRLGPDKRGAHLIDPFIEGFNRDIL